VINISDLRSMGYFDAIDADKDPLKAYSNWVETKILTSRSERLVENTLGLVGEAGEVAEKVKKLIRDKSKFSNKDIIKELGDVMFYVTALANYHGSDLGEVIEENVKKLESRQARGKLKGNGDDR
tara:strand:- start:14 stop:388 length:375 start_codon:yes stop_codon:yes gene_type:complete